MSSAISPPIQDDDLLTFTLMGAERHQGFVELSELADCLERIKECLRATERCITKKKPSLTYLVHQMTVGSPAVCTLKAKKPQRGIDYSREAFGLLRSTVASLECGDKKLDPRLDHDALRSFRKFGEIGHRSDERDRCKLIVDRTPVTYSFLIAADKALEIQESSYGSVSGVLEKIDVHGRYSFAIFLPIGGHQVACSFHPELMHDVQAALRKTVTVYGKLHYVADRMIPIKADVDQIESHEPAEILPKLTAMAGCLSHLSDDSLTLAGRIRNEWRE